MFWPSSSTHHTYRPLQTDDDTAGIQLSILPDRSNERSNERPNERPTFPNPSAPLPETLCQFCRHPTTNGRRLPSCGHAFCLTCLEIVAAPAQPHRVFRCTACHTTCLVPASGLSSLPLESTQSVQPALPPQYAQYPPSHSSATQGYGYPVAQSNAFYNQPVYHPYAQPSLPPVLDGNYRGLQWGLETGSTDKINLHGDKLSVSLDSRGAGYALGSLPFTSGRWSWSLKINTLGKTCEVTAGVIQKIPTLPDDYMASYTAYAWTSTGYVFSSAGPSDSCPKARCENGDVLHFVLDLTQMTLTRTNPRTNAVLTLPLDKGSIQERGPFYPYIHISSFSEAVSVSVFS